MNEDIEVIVCSMDNHLKKHGIPPIGKVIIKIDKKKLRSFISNREMRKNES